MFTRVQTYIFHTISVAKVDGRRHKLHPQVVCLLSDLGPKFGRLLRGEVCLYIPFVDKRGVSRCQTTAHWSVMGKGYRREPSHVTSPPSVTRKICPDACHAIKTELFVPFLNRWSRSRRRNVLDKTYPTMQSLPCNRDFLSPWPSRAEKKLWRVRQYCLLIYVVWHGGAVVHLTLAGALGRKS